MPKWGMTRQQIESKPWGLDPEWLMPCKVLTDQVHGDVYLNVLETRLVDAEPLQRLRRVRQLGTTHLVYPGATHSRLAHSLGTLRAAQDLLDSVVDNRNGPRPNVDFFADWLTVPKKGTDISEFDQKLAEVTVLTRLGALLHDLCHVPYGHTIEDDLRVLRPHDRNAIRFRKLWAMLPGDVRDLLDGAPELKPNLLPLIISKDPKTGKNLEPDDMLYPFVADIVGNTICADLIDYLTRDHLNTGLPIALGYRFANEFYVLPSNKVHWAKRMVVKISRGNQRRADVVTELLKYLRFRYELSERVLNHHAKLAADAMIGKLLEMWSDWLWIDIARQYDDPLVTKMVRRNLTGLKEELSHRIAPELPDDFESTNSAEVSVADVILHRVRSTIEDVFLERSDDGLLEYLRDWGNQEGDSRRKTVGILARAVLDRRLFHLIGVANDPADRANAEKIYTDFGGIDDRRQLETGAAAFAELREGWQVVIWVPKPTMRLKVAEVLIDDRGQITQLDRADFPGVAEIYSNHKNLWAVYVYAHRGIAEECADPEIDPEAVIRAYLSDAMGIRIRPPEGEADSIASDRMSAALRLAVQQTIEADGLTPEEAVRMTDIAARHERESAGPTFRELKRRIALWAEETGDSRGDVK